MIEAISFSLQGASDPWLGEGASGLCPWGMCTGEATVAEGDGPGRAIVHFEAEEFGEPHGADEHPGHQGIGGLDDVSETNGEPDDGMDMGSAFGRIGIDERHPRAALQDGLDFPSEIESVPDTGGHPLAQEGRHLVRGVAHDKDASPLPGAGDECMESVDYRAFHLVILGFRPVTDHFLEFCRRDHFFRVVAGHQHEFPSIARRGRGNEGSGPFGVAQVLGEVVVFDRPLHDDIDDGPGLVQAEVFEFGFHPFADKTPAAIAAQNERRPDRRGPAGFAVDKTDLGILGSRFNRLDVHSETKFDGIGVTLEAPPDFRLQGGLMEKGQQGIAERLLFLTEIETAHATSAGPNEIHAVKREDVVFVGLAEAGGLEDAHDLVVHAHCPGERVDFRIAFKNEGLDTAGSEQIGHDAADGAATDDDDVGCEGRGCLLRAHESRA